MCSQRLWHILANSQTNREKDRQDRLTGRLTEAGDYDYGRVRPTLAGYGLIDYLCGIGGQINRQKGRQTERGSGKLADSGRQTHRQTERQTIR